MCNLFKMNLRLLAIFLIAATGLLFVGCEEDSEDPVDTGTENVKLSNNSTLGSILVDADGNTLYFFTRDTKGQSNCAEGNCLTAWPIFYVENIEPGEGLEASDFENITRADGKPQTTYKGWPLYYFVNDNAAGDTNGEAVNNVWFVAKPDYSIMLADAQLVGADGKNYTAEYVEGEAITQYLVDAEGRTLYAFANDGNNVNNYTNSDFSNNAAWPIFYVEIESLPSTLNKADFAEIDVFGEPQLTFKGWPLYYFGLDEDRGDNKGVSVPSPGIWPIVNNDTEVAP